MIDIGSLEIFITLIIALLVIGPKRLPEIARNIGRWIGQIRRFITKLREDSEIDKYIDTLKSESGVDEFNNLDIQEDLQKITHPVQTVVDDIKQTTNEIKENVNAPTSTKKQTKKSQKSD